MTTKKATKDQVHDVSAEKSDPVKQKVEQPETTPHDQQQVRIIERVIENHEIAPADAFGKLNRPQIELLKRTVAKGATDDELRLFIQVCKGANLNPFLKQVHLVKRWDSKSGQEVGAIQVGIDGFRAVAESSGQYAGNDDPTFESEKEIELHATEKSAARKIKVPNKATAVVYKLLEGQRYAFSATARWEEYYPGPKMGFQWHQRPFLMLGKCAEALALRKAFPKLLSGMYAAEEMEKGKDTEDTEKRAQTAFQKLKSVIATSDRATLIAYESKMQSSEKYTGEQKREFAQIVEARIAELNSKVGNIRQTETKD